MKVYADNFTPEKPVEVLSKNSSAISSISSEGDIFDFLSATYSNKVNIDIFLKAYSRERISIDRVGCENIIADDACLTILLSVQPIVIGDLMKNEKFRHRGLTARFLYTHPKSRVGERDFHSVAVSPDKYEQFKMLIFNILSENRGSAPEIIHLSPEAKENLQEFYDWTEKRLVDEFSVYSDWIGKLVGNTLRIAGILARSSAIRKDVGDALLECDDRIAISGEIMRNAIRIGKYFFSHAIRAYSSMGVYSEFQSIQKAIEKIREKDLRTITRRSLTRICRWMVSSAEAQQAVDALEDYRYIRLINVDFADKLRGGRPKNPTFAVNPRVFEQ